MERLQTHDLALPQMLHNLSMNSMVSCPSRTSRNPNSAEIDRRDPRTQPGVIRRPNGKLRLEPRKDASFLGRSCAPARTEETFSSFLGMTSSLVVRFGANGLVSRK